MSYTIIGIREGSIGTGTERITHVSIRNDGSKAVNTHTVDQIIAALLKGIAFTSGIAWGPAVEEVPRGHSAKYIRSDANGTVTDNLLSLPRI